jgi:hypothetical protein
VTKSDKKRIHVVIVDDQDNSRRRLVKRLSSTDIRCTPLRPPSHPDPETIVALKPDAVLVDYQLTTQEKGATEPPASYLGSLLVAAIRERFPAKPIILITRRSLAKQTDDFLAQAKDLDEAYDALVFKEAIDHSPELYRQMLRSLVAGYHTLRRSETWADVVAALETPEYAKDELRRFGSPAGEPFRPASISRWIRRVVLAFPGPLLDELWAATEVGIAPTSFRSKAVEKWFEPARYTGAFALDHERWWRGALRARAELFVREANATEPQTFVEAWNEAHPRSPLTAAKCCVCGEPTNEAVCSVLHKPVMLRHSLPFYPDNRPPGFDVARISFKAIQTKEIKEEQFASNVVPILRRIEDGHED